MDGALGAHCTTRYGTVMEGEERKSEVTSIPVGAVFLGAGA